MKLDKNNVGPDHLSRIETVKAGGLLNDQLPDSYLFRIEDGPDYLEDIETFQTTGLAPQEYMQLQKKPLVVRAADYQLIARHFDKLGIDGIIRFCIMDHECQGA